MVWRLSWLRASRLSCRSRLDSLIEIGLGYRLAFIVVTVSSCCRHCYALVATSCDPPCEPWAVSPCELANERAIYITGNVEPRIQGKSEGANTMCDLES